MHFIFPLHERTILANFLEPGLQEGIFVFYREKKRGPHFFLFFMNHNNTLFAYGREDGRLVIVDARDMNRRTEYLKSENVPSARKTAISEYGGINGSFTCCYGHELIFHNFKNGHFQHKSNTNTGQSGVNMTCCPCQNKDYETQKESISILSKILSNPSIIVKLHQFCENGRHDEITVIPNDVTVRLHERTTGNLGYKSGEIKPNVAVYDDQGQQILLLECSKTNRKTPESRPDNTIEMDPSHVVLMYEKFNENGNNIIVLKPITRKHGTCHKCEKQTEDERLRKEEEKKRLDEINEKEKQRKIEEQEKEKQRKIEEERKKQRKIEEEEDRLRIKEAKELKIDLKKNDNAELARSFRSIEDAYLFVHELDIPNGKTFKWRKDNLGPIKFREKMDAITRKYGDKVEIMIAYNVLKEEMKRENKAEQDLKYIAREQIKEKIEKDQANNHQPGFNNKVSGSEYNDSQEEIDRKRADRKKRQEEQRNAKNQKKRKR